MSKDNTEQPSRRSILKAIGLGAPAGAAVAVIASANAATAAETAVTEPGNSAYERPISRARFI